MKVINNIKVNKSFKNKINEVLREYGVVIIPNYLSSEVVGKLRTEFDDFISSPDTPYKKETPYSNGKCSRVSLSILDSERYKQTSDVFERIFMDTVARTYFGHNNFDLNSDIFVVKDVVGSRHIANDLHFDVQPTLKFFIYLTDTKAENGAFSCVPGSHLKTKKIRDSQEEAISFDNREITRDLPVNEDEVIPIEGEAGTLIIFTTETFHKAGTVSKGERLVMRGHTREINNYGLIERIKRKAKKIFK